jgi:hypothetical protein
MANTKTDDLVAALNSAGVPVGTLANRQRTYLAGFTGVSTGSFADQLRSLGMTQKVLLPVPLPPVV